MEIPSVNESKAQLEQQVLRFVHLAADTGADLIDANLYQEASYHFQLALEKILDFVRNEKLREEGDNARGAKERSFDGKQECHVSYFIHSNVLGARIRLREITKTNYASTAAEMETANKNLAVPEPELHTLKRFVSSYEYRYWWMPSVAAGLLYNSAVMQFQTKCYSVSKKLLKFSFEILQSEIMGKSEAFLKSFFGVVSNVTWVLSMHYLMAHAILQESRYSSPKVIISVAAALKAKEHCLSAVHLAQDYIKADDVQNNLVLAPIISLLGYCRVLENVYPRPLGDDDISDMEAPAIYGAAVTMYNGYHLSSTRETGCIQGPNVSEDDKKPIRHDDFHAPENCHIAPSA